MATIKPKESKESKERVKLPMSPGEYDNLKLRYEAQVEDDAERERASWVFADEGGF